jgi:hypothetical protein
MNHQLNPFMAVLLITLIGAGASLIIIRVANNTNFEYQYVTSVYTLPAATSTTHRARSIY